MLAAVTLVDAERDHILAVLREADCVLGGPKGAAARLGMKRTTLQSKVNKLAISRPALVPPFRHPADPPARSPSALRARS